MYASDDTRENYVIIPVDEADVDTHSSEYEVANYYSALSSLSKVNFVCKRISLHYRQQHIRHKDSLNDCSHNISYNHRRKMLRATQGVLEKSSDKTVVKFDKFINDDRNGSLWNNRFLF